MVYTLRFFSSKCNLFHNSNIFGSCIIHILYTGCAKIKKNNSGAKRLISALMDSVAFHAHIFTKFAIPHLRCVEFCLYRINLISVKEMWKVQVEIYVRPQVKWHCP